MEEILKSGKCVECKNPTSKETLKWNGGTCEPCTDEEMAEAESELDPDMDEDQDQERGTPCDCLDCVDENGEWCGLDYYPETEEWVS